MRALSLLLALTACTGAPDETDPSEDTDADTDADTDSDTDTDTDSDTDTDTDSDTDTDADPRTEPCVSGTPSVQWFHEGAWDDITSAVPTTGGSVGLTPDQGILTFCGGAWKARISTLGDVEVVGFESPELDGGAQGSVLLIQGDGTDGGIVSVEGIRLTNGRALTGTTYGGRGGGGVMCDRASGTLTLTDVEIAGNDGADYGGGLYVGGCDVTIADSTISGNASGYGGAVFVGSAHASRLTITNTSIAANAATGTGGALYVAADAAPADVHVTDSLVSGNTAGARGGGLVMSEAATVTCTASGSAPAGFVGNTAADRGGAAYLVNFYGGDPTFTSSGCDFGASATGDDNAPEDVFLFVGSATYAYGNDASFTCTGSTCF